MKKQIFSFLLILIFVFSVSAQEKESHKFGELPSLWQCDFVISNLDNFFLELQNNPQTTGFIIVYEGKYEIYSSKRSSKTKTYLPRRGEATYRTQIIRNHIKLRSQSPDRFLFIDGGFREEHKIELWIVPNGAKLPIPNSTLEGMKYRKGKPHWECGL